MDLSVLFKKLSHKLDIDFNELPKEISHALTAGEAREYALRRLLKDYLPQRIEIDNGFIIDTSGRQSRQIDIVIYDRTVATIFNVEGAKYFPCETVIAVGQVKSDIDSREDLRNALDNIESVKQLDRSNKGENELITGPGISLKGLKFNPVIEHRDQIFSFIFTRTTMSNETVIEEIMNYQKELSRNLWMNLFCAYRDFLISYESDDKLTPSPMNADSMYCTDEGEKESILLLFLSILSDFINKAHVARPNYFSYGQIHLTKHINYFIK